MSYKNYLILNVMFDFESYPVGVLMTGPLCRVAVASDWIAVNPGGGGGGTWVLNVYPLPNSQLER